MDGSFEKLNKTKTSPDKYDCNTTDSRNRHTRIGLHVSYIPDILEIHFLEIPDHQPQHFVHYECRLRL